jgi:hypothetical protein
MRRARIIAGCVVVALGAGATACERFETHMARELIRLRYIHEALLEEAATLYIEMQKEGRIEDAEAFRRTIADLDGNIRHVEYTAALALMALTATNRKEEKRRLAESVSLLLELVGRLASTIRAHKGGGR